MRLRRLAIKLLMRVSAAGAENIYDTERSLFPCHLVGRVRICGQDAFISGVKQALLTLQTLYPFGHSMVQRYIRAIIQSHADPDYGVSIGVVYHDPTPEGVLRLSEHCFAAFLVRRAEATRKLLGFQIWRSRRSALGSLNRELEAMRRLKCEGRYFHQQMNKILQLERQLGRQHTKGPL
jgi:hypothetical protein